jgi:hypothetical protein
MQKYDVVAVIWDDHIAFERCTLIENPAKVLTPTLTIGFLFKETKDALIVVSNIERYHERDDANYIVILKGCIRGIKRYGKIKIKKIRCRGD